MLTCMGTSYGILGIFESLAGLEQFAAGQGLELRFDGFYDIDCGCPPDIDSIFANAWSRWLSNLQDRAFAYDEDY